MQCHYEDAYLWLGDASYNRSPVADLVVSSDGAVNKQQLLPKSIKNIH